MVVRGIVALLGCLALAGCGARSAPATEPPPAAAFETGVPTWAEGSVLHVGEATYDVSPLVIKGALVAPDAALLQVAEAQAEDYDRTWSWYDGRTLVPVDGDPDGPMLSPDGSHAAWIDRDGPLRPAGRIAELVVVDTATREVVLADHDHMGGGFGDDLGDRYEELEPSVVGLDDQGRVSWRDADGAGELWTVDLATGDKEQVGNPVLPDEARPYEVRETYPGRPRFHDPSTGEDLRVDSGHRFTFFGAWLDDDTVAVVGSDDYEGAYAYDEPDTSDGTVMTCELPTGTCEPFAEVGGLRHFVWADGGWSFAAF